MSNEIIVNFNSGEMTPQTDARDDIEKYAGGCRQLDNMIPDQFGNATKRPGTELIVAGNGAACYYPVPIPDTAKIQIYTPQDVQDMQDDLTEDYELMNNLDMTGFSWTPVGDADGNRFSGTLEGNYFTVSNLTITGVDYLGIFGFVNQTASFSNIRCSDFTIEGHTYIGALVGNFGGGATTFSRCAADNITITSNTETTGDYDLQYTGGLIGGAQGSITGSTITECFATNISLRAEKFSLRVGGLVGSPTTNTTDCYSTGSFIGWHYITGATGMAANKSWIVGGLSGEGSIRNFTRCYAAVLVPALIAVLSNDVGGICGSDTGLTTTDNFWDLDVSEIIYGCEGTNQAGITGKTTAQMYAEATYTNWDFDDIWEIDEGLGYPTLIWKRTEMDRRIVCQRI